MIDKKHEITQTLATSPDLKKSDAAKPRERKTGGKVSIFIAVIALLLAMATLAAGFYVWQQLQINQQRNNTQIHNLQKKLTDTNVLLKQQDLVLQTEQRNFQDFLRQNQQKEGGRTLVEVNDLVRAAAFHLTFENNVVVARQLLQAADRRIAADESAVLWPLRQVLAQDITMLEATPTVDLPGLVARIGALSREAQELPQLPVKVLQKNVETSNKIETFESPSFTSTSLNAAKRFMFAVGDALSNMIIVSKDNPLTPFLLTAEQRRYVVTNIQSQLTLAQWAAVHRQESIYGQSLAQVEDWLQHYFSGDSPLVQSMLKTIANLKTTSVNPSTPDISRSLDALQSMQAVKKEAN